jgi:hypothetical protein
VYVARPPRVTRSAAPSRRGKSWDQLNRLPLDLWAALLADDETITRYHAKIHKRPEGCWYWLGAISDSGHGRLRAGTRLPDPDRPGSHVVASHVYGYQLSRGVLRRGSDGHLPLIRHSCDEASCHRPRHWLTGTVEDNSRDYVARSRTLGSPLTDSRGPRGRAVSIRDAILRARALGLDVEQAIWSASAAGLPAVADPLW